MRTRKFGRAASGNLSLGGNQLAMNGCSLSLLSARGLTVGPWFGRVQCGE
jgi:hypothetical protein